MENSDKPALGNSSQPTLAEGNLTRDKVITDSVTDNALPDPEPLPTSNTPGDISRAETKLQVIPATIDTATEDLVSKGQIVEDTVPSNAVAITLPDHASLILASTPERRARVESSSILTLPTRSGSPISLWGNASEFDVELDTLSPSVPPPIGTDSTDHLIAQPPLCTTSSLGGSFVVPATTGDRPSTESAGSPTTEPDPPVPNYKPIPLRWQFSAFLLVSMAGLFAFLEYQVRNLPPLRYTLLDPHGPISRPDGIKNHGNYSAASLPSFIIARPDRDLYPSPIYPLETYCGWGLPYWDLSVLAKPPMPCDDGSADCWTSHVLLMASEMISTFVTDDPSWCPCRLFQKPHGGNDWGLWPPQVRDYLWDTTDSGCSSVMVAIGSLRQYKEYYATTVLTSTESVQISGLGDLGMGYSSGEELGFITTPPHQFSSSMGFPWHFAKTDSGGNLLIPLVTRTAGLHTMDVWGNPVMSTDSALFPERWPTEPWHWAPPEFEDRSDAMLRQNDCFDNYVVFRDFIFEVYDAPPRCSWTPQPADVASIVWWTLPLSMPGRELSSASAVSSALSSDSAITITFALDDSSTASTFTPAKPLPTSAAVTATSVLTSIPTHITTTFGLTKSRPVPTHASRRNPAAGSFSVVAPEPSSRKSSQSKPRSQPAPAISSPARKTPLPKPPSQFTSITVSDSTILSISLDIMVPETVLQDKHSPVSRTENESSPDIRLLLQTTSPDSVPDIPNSSSTMDVLSHPGLSTQESIWQSTDVVQQATAEIPTYGRNRNLPPHPTGPIPPSSQSKYFNLRSEADYLMITVVPVLLATVLLILVQVLVTSLYSILPFRALRHDQGALFEDSLGQSHSPNILFTPFIASRYWRRFRDPLPLLGTLLSGFATVLVTISTELIRLDTTPNCGRSAWDSPSPDRSDYLICGVGLRNSGAIIRVAEAILVFLATLVIFIAVVLARWRSGLAAHPWSIASLASMISPPDSELHGLLRSAVSAPDKTPNTNIGAKVQKALDGRRFKLEFFLQAPTSEHEHSSSRTAHGNTTSPPTYSIHVVPTSNEDNIPIRPTVKDPPVRKAVDSNKAATNRLFWRGWSSFTWHLFARIVAAMLITGLLIMILCYETIVGVTTGFESFMNSQTIGVRILFAAFGTSIDAFWNYYFSYTSESQIHNLLAKQPRQAKSSILLSPPLNTFVGLWRLSRKVRQDPLQFNIALAAFFAKFTPIVLSNIPFSNTVTWKIHEACTWLAVAFLSHMVLILLVSFLLPVWRRMNVTAVVGAFFKGPMSEIQGANNMKQREMERPAPSTPVQQGSTVAKPNNDGKVIFPMRTDTIVGCLYYLFESEMVRDFEGLSLKGVKERDRLVSGMNRWYWFGGVSVPRDSVEAQPEGTSDVQRDVVKVDYFTGPVDGLGGKGRNN